MDDVVIELGVEYRVRRVALADGVQHVNLNNPQGLTAAWLDEQPEHVAERILTEMPPEASEALAHDWEFIARADQLPPPGLWQVWLYLAGRGTGKTRAGIEWVRRKIKEGAKRIALIGPTTSATRDVLIEGESGILAHAWERDRDDSGNLMGRPLYEPSKRRLTWANGAPATAVPRKWSSAPG